MCVAEYHTYFIGHQIWGFAVWSHNMSATCNGDGKKGRGWLNWAKLWHDNRATKIFGPGKGRQNIGGRNYDKLFNGKDVEFKANAFGKRPLSQEGSDRMEVQIGKDLDNLQMGRANPHWHFENDPKLEPKMGPLLDQLDGGEIPWTWGPDAPGS